MINYNKEEYENAVAFTGEFAGVKAGGYICEIIDSKVEQSKKGNDMLVLAIDIAEGDYKGFFAKQFEERKNNAKSPEKAVKYPNNAVIRCVLSGENWINRFKGIITSIEKSNEGFNWKSCNGDESKLKGLMVGAIFSEEEYERLDGSVGTAVKVHHLRSVDAIKNGDYKIPNIKKLPSKGEAFEDFMSLTDSNSEELPF